MLERVRRKGNPPILLVGMPILLVGMSIGAAPIENSMEVPQKTKKNYHIIQQSRCLHTIFKQETQLYRFMYDLVLH